MNHKVWNFSFLLMFVFYQFFLQSGKVVAESNLEDKYLSLSQDGRYVRVGLDGESQQSVYLDINSIRKIKPDHFKYTLITDRSRRFGFESIFIVNCNKKKYVTPVVQRYYKNGRLYKTEYLGRGRSVIANTNHDGFPEYESNQVVCSGPE
jgi:hypothetical protein